ncbi:MAG: hypothetical protein AAGE76_07930 [Pseudomonadota bacterium]
MSDLKSLSARVDAALSVLEAGGAGGGDAPARIAALEAENRALTEKLAALDSARESDLAQLDDLIAQLRPLIDEAV